MSAILTAAWPIVADQEFAEPSARSRPALRSGKYHLGYANAQAPVVS
jgi:hypothetical protein